MVTENIAFWFTSCFYLLHLCSCRVTVQGRVEKRVDRDTGICRTYLSGKTSILTASFLETKSWRESDTLLSPSDIGFVFVLGLLYHQNRDADRSWEPKVYELRHETKSSYVAEYSEIQTIPMSISQKDILSSVMIPVTLKIIYSNSTMMRE